MKTALVSGATGGIGEAIIKKLLRDGFLVVGLYNKNHEKAEKLKKETAIELYPLNLCLDNNICLVIDQILEKYKKIDVLVNNAGISQQKLFTDLSDLDVNLKGAMLLTKAVVPAMISQKYGRIINISSVWGVCGGSCEVHYSASKAGLIGFTKALAKELGPSGITVNCIAPGLIDTDMNNNLTQEDKEEFAMQTALQRIGSPQDVANLVSFLAGESSGYITSQVIGVDGGI